MGDVGLRREEQDPTAEGKEVTRVEGGLSPASAGFAVPGSGQHSHLCQRRHANLHAQSEPQSLVGQRKGVVNGVCVKGKVGRVLHLVWPVTCTSAPYLRWECFRRLKGNVSSLLQH